MYLNWKGNSWGGKYSVGIALRTLKFKIGFGEFCVGVPPRKNSAQVKEDTH